MSKVPIDSTQKSIGAQPSIQEHYIIAVGASAGGLEAIHVFFDHLTESTNLSFVIIQHLSPDYKSLLVDLVSKHTHMKVFEAEHNMPVLPDCIYVIPPKKLMTIAGGRLELSEKKKGDKSPNTAIDTFLHTLAYEKGEKSIAIILSGTGTDGTKGAESIKNNGGLVIVQEPSSARFDGMPKSAIPIADMVLTPEQMPAEISSHLKEIPASIFRKGKVDHHIMEDIFHYIYKHTGADFHYYKLPTLLRRIARRMMVLNFTLIDEYRNYLKNHPEECKLLSKDFLIGVTRFFRDQDAFFSLKENVIAATVDKKEEGENIKVWICACSSGEEAYSIAIIINEYLALKGKQLNVKIFATDIDEEAIEKAAKGIYTASAIKDVPEPYINKYFLKEGKMYLVSPELRKQIVFARHNIISDPPFIKNDLISCRNMLIYMDSTLQKKVLNTLGFSLNLDGFLMLGSSETITPLQNSMKEIDRKWKIFRKTANGATRYSAPFTTDHSPLFTQHYSSRTRSQENPPDKSLLSEDLHESIIDDLGYAAVYIDRNYEIKEATGGFRRYLSLPEHSLHLNLMKMVPPELATALGTAIRKCWKLNTKITVQQVTIKDHQKKHTRNISLLVKPPKSEDKSFHTLIVFGERESLPLNVKEDTHAQENAEEHYADNYVDNLQAELRETKISLQTAIESLETANEELQSTNEELLSGNEELQSSNEELQSLNEELHTLNTEHQIKITELIELNDDLNNFFSSVDVGQIFLDAKLCIRKFNPAAVKLINFIDSDINRPFTHISNNLTAEHLNEDVEKVHRTGESIEKEIQLTNGRVSLMRITPYLRQDKKKDGIVLSFVDITTVKNLNNIITGVFNASQSSITALRSVRDEHHRIADFQYLTANHATERLLGKPREHFVGKTLLSVFPDARQKKLFEKYVKVVEQDIQIRFEYPVLLHDKQSWWEISAVKMGDGLAATITDITEKKSSEERLRNNYNELIRTREELKQLNAVLETRIQDRTKELSASEERFRLVSRATNDAIWDWDLVGNTVWLSDSFYAMFGYHKVASQIKRTYWLEKIHPEDRARVNDSITNAINTNRRQWTFEYRYLKADGVTAFILDRGYILHDEYGTPYRMLSSMLDVTALRKTERDYIESVEQREFLAESMPLIVWTASPLGKVNFINQHFASYTGISIHQAKGLGWEGAIDPEHLIVLKELWKESIRKKEDFSMELKLKSAEGTYRWHLLRALAKKDEKDRLIMWVGTNTDIHEQKQVTEIMEQKIAERTVELQNSNRQLELSNHDLQQFASVASHDLKEPLRKIHMFSQMLKERYLKDSEGGNQYIDRIISSSSRMTKLINDLLNFSRLSVNSLFEPVSINSIIEEVLADLELAILEKNASVKVDDFPVVDAIPGQIRQVFQNIISNALKFTRKGEKPIIQIQCRRVKERKFDAADDSKGTYLRITISDNGIGFDQQFRDKIFTIFQRLHTKQQFEGTGIGLAICKKIVDKHNGIISAQGKENEGAVFIIVIPMKQPKAS